MTNHNEASKDYRFQINLKGMINLLSDHLYSSPDVFIRELLQNAVDALSMREDLCDEAFEPSIQVEIVHHERLILTDTGIGLTEDEVHQFLATIGQSIKSSEKLEHLQFKHQTRSSYLGQFGIGLLACFMVSDEIEVFTRSAKSPDAPVLRWLGQADGTYSVEHVELDMEPGTRVDLKAKRGKENHFTQRYVKERLLHYGRFLGAPLYLIVDEVTVPLNRDPLWKRENVGSQEWYEEALSLGFDVFGEEFTDVIYLESQAGDVNGLAFVTGRQAKSSVQRKDHVYLKGMLLSDSMDQLLPSWAFFTRAIMNTQTLQPVASREAFSEGDQLKQARRELAGCLRAYLKSLAGDNSERFHDFLQTHYYALKHLCAEDLEFLELIGPWLPLETSSGKMSISDCIQRSGGSLFYAPTLDQFRELSLLAGAKNLTLINAGYSYDLAILSAYAQRNQIELIMLDADALISQMTSLSDFEAVFVDPVLQVAREVLERFNCQVSFKSFEPATVPALYSINHFGRWVREVEAVAKKSNELFQTILTDLTADQEAQEASRPHFIINYTNSIAQTLPMISDERKLQRLIEVLYVQTLLLGHHAMNEQELSLISESLTGLMMLSIEVH